MALIDETPFSNILLFRGGEEEEDWRVIAEDIFRFSGDVVLVKALFVLDGR